jgi:tetratricopeptide (TPR) repeat protein
MKARQSFSALATCALVALLTACSAAPAPIPAPSPESLADCKQTKDPARAIAGCSTAIDAGSKDAQLRVNRGFAYFLKADYDRSLADYNEAIRLNPKDPATFQRRGLTLRARGDDDRAIADLTKAISLGSTDLNVYIDRGMAHFTKGEFPEAIADYTIAVERDGDKTFAGQLAHVVRGLALIYSGAPDKAQADLARALELHPNEPFFALFLHIAELRAGEAKARVHLATTTAGVDMTKWPAPAIRLFLAAGTPEAVLAVQGGEVTTCEADYLVGEFLLSQSNKDEAIRLFRKAQTDCPRYILERVAAGAALRSLGLTP